MHSDSIDTMEPEFKLSTLFSDAKDANDVTEIRVILSFTPQTHPCERHVSSL